MPEKVYYATGKRKTSIARVWMKPGDGKVTVNDQDLNQYFKLDTAKMIIFQPLELTGTLGQFDIDITVLGGGMKGQAGAIRHGITRGLLSGERRVSGIAEEGRPHHPGPPEERAQKIRPERRPEEIPILQTVIRVGVKTREGLPAFPFLLPK